MSSGTWHGTGSTVDSLPCATGHITTTMKLMCASDHLLGRHQRIAQVHLGANLQDSCKVCLESMH